MCREFGVSRKTFYKIFDSQVAHRFHIEAVYQLPSDVNTIFAVQLDRTYRAGPIRLMLLMIAKIMVVLRQFFEDVDLRLVSDDEIAGAHVSGAGAHPFALAAAAVFAFPF